jgi:hypothetical protein
MIYILLEATIQTAILSLWYLKTFIFMTVRNRTGMTQLKVILNRCTGRRSIRNFKLGQFFPPGKYFAVPERRSGPHFFLKEGKCHCPLSFNQPLLLSHIKVNIVTACICDT